MIPGDLVRLKHSSKYEYEMILFRVWGNFPGGMEHVGKFKSDEVGTVLEDSLPHGGDGCKVITSSGIVGWMRRGDLEVLQ